MSRRDASTRGRDAFLRRQWRKAYACFAEADQESDLGPDDLERFATAAWLVGRDAEARTIWTRAHHDLIDRGGIEDTARIGFWLSLSYLLAGEVAPATGWLARSQRLLEDLDGECAASGYGLMVTGLLATGKGNLDGAGAAFDEAAALARQHGDADLLALSQLGQGETLIRSGAVAGGLARLDEAMVAVTSGEVSPVFAGIIYCAVILACYAVFDLRRAGEWTRHFDRWSAGQPDLVPYRGQCLVHRSEVLQLRGDWTGALAEARRAREHLADRAEAVVGRACYQQGELHRLRGEFEDAEVMYREADRHGCEPQPGVSLLRLAGGRPDAATASVRAALDAEGPARARLLGPAVEILVAAGEPDAAAELAEELCRLAREWDTPFLLAASALAMGRIEAARGNAKEALSLLRDAWRRLQDLDALYECARVRALIGQLCRDLGDDESSRMHFNAAASTFSELGAAPDLAIIQRQMEKLAAEPAGTLTRREREVLARIAVGETNREVAAVLGISEHTVARHLSNIFDKLGVTTRMAAATLAREQDLI